VANEIKPEDRKAAAIIDKSVLRYDTQEIEADPIGFMTQIIADHRPVASEGSAELTVDEVLRGAAHLRSELEKAEAELAQVKAALDRREADYKVHLKQCCMDMARWESALAASQKEVEELKIVIEEIGSSTGPTGGWLDSPKAVCAAIVERLRLAGSSSRKGRK